MSDQCLVFRCRNLRTIQKHGTTLTPGRRQNHSAFFCCSRTTPQELRFHHRLHCSATRTTGRRSQRRQQSASNGSNSLLQHRFICCEGQPCRTISLTHSCTDSSGNQKPLPDYSIQAAPLHRSMPAGPERTRRPSEAQKTPVFQPKALSGYCPTQNQADGDIAGTDQKHRIEHKRQYGRTGSSQV